jgi:exosortase C (VPDSG-CTERM-specific)
LDDSFSAHWLRPRRWRATTDFSFQLSTFSIYPMSDPHPVSSCDPSSSETAGPSDFWSIGPKRMWGGLGALGLLCGVLLPVFLTWYRIAMGSDLHSHVILIPVISIYLLVTGRGELAWSSKPSPLLGIAVMAVAAAVLGWGLVANPAWSMVDSTALKILSFVGLVWGLGFWVLGSRWMRSAAFPLGFLLFMVPLPDAVVLGLEKFLMVLSAQLAAVLFAIGGIPIFRNGQVLELPGTVLEVAQECSGIRSSWVLLITSTLASYMFLPTVPRRIALVAAVLPLAILRNSVRIFVIGWMCVHYGPEMIDHWIHRKGGPLFFAASLVPLFLLAWWLRKRKVKGADLKDSEVTGGSAP